jgi:hypothetical protein
MTLMNLIQSVRVDESLLLFHACAFFPGALHLIMEAAMMRYRRRVGCVLDVVALAVPGFVVNKQLLTILSSLDEASINGSRTYGIRTSCPFVFRTD